MSKISYIRKGSGVKGDKIIGILTYKSLAALFNVSHWAVRKWVYNKLLDPTSLKDIIYKYNNRHLLDKRRKNK